MTSKFDKAAKEFLTEMPHVCIDTDNTMPTAIVDFKIEDLLKTNKSRGIETTAGDVKGHVDKVITSIRAELAQHPLMRALARRLNVSPRDIAG